MAYFEQTIITTPSGVPVSPASEDTQQLNSNLLEMLGRLIKLMESNAVVDSAQRQRIAVDAALPTGANTIGAVNIAASQTLATVTTVSGLTAIAGMDREQYINIAKQTYATSIRNQLSFV